MDTWTQGSSSLPLLTQVRPPHTVAGVSGAGGYMALLLPPHPPQQILIQAHTCTQSRLLE